MVHFVGAGSGAADLITVRGAKLLGEADVVIYAGSLVNPAVLDYTKPGCEKKACSDPKQGKADGRPEVCCDRQLSNAHQYLHRGHQQGQQAVPV